MPPRRDETHGEANKAIARGGGGGGGAGVGEANVKGRSLGLIAGERTKCFSSPERQTTHVYRVVRAIVE